MSTTLIPEHLELVRSLKQAIKNKEKHQQKEFNCGTSCCMAGNKVIRDFPGLAKYLSDFSMCRHALPEEVDLEARLAWKKPWRYAESAYKITDYFAEIVFSSGTTFRTHELAVKILENGLYEKLKNWTWIVDVSVGYSGDTLNLISAIPPVGVDFVDLRVLTPDLAFDRLCEAIATTKAGA